ADDASKAAGHLNLRTTVGSRGGRVTVTGGCVDKHQALTRALAGPLCSDLGGKGGQDDLGDVAETGDGTEVHGVDPHLAGTHPQGLAGRDGASLRGEHLVIPGLLGGLAPVNVQAGNGVLVEV